MTIQSDSKVKLLSIVELLNKDYFIPNYQRGYRWEKQQVFDLLNDINRFEQTKDNFYCLQPIVVSKIDEKYHLIDGQQRLTTIFLIVHFFNEMWVGKQKFSEPKIEYSTREKCYVFLKNLEIGENGKTISSEKCDEYIDYLYISKAYDSIHKWVNQQGNTFDSNKFQSKFLHNTKVIWFEISNLENEQKRIDTFSRINIGKIPLTNAELIKALFLQKRNFTSPELAEIRQIEISKEWDNMEFSLQNNEFWYFLNKNINSGKYISSRIEFIFDLMCETNSLCLSENYKETIGTDSYKVFRYFDLYFRQENNDFLKLWEHVVEIFQHLNDWFEDKLYYHRIGYLVFCGFSLAKILETSTKLNKNEFIDYLQNEIRSTLTKSKNIEELEYGKDNETILRILLLHNIETILKNQSCDTRFSFYKCKKDSWSLEHIHAQNSKELETLAEFEDWLKAIDTSQLSKEIREEIKNIKEDRNYIKTLVEKIVNSFGIPNIHSIENLALLLKSDNSSISNNIFPTKRKEIIELEKNGSFIPICTRNVFLKYYSKNNLQISKWETCDRQEYLNDIMQTLQSYFKD